MFKHSKLGAIIFILSTGILILTPNTDAQAGTKYTASLNRSTFNYTGTRQVPKITVKTSAKKKVSSKKYTVSFLNQKNKAVKVPTNPGTYTVKIKFKNKKIKSLSKKFKIVSTQYFIKYDANGGEGLLSDQTCKTSQKYALYNNTFVRYGYSFKEWNTKPDGSGQSYRNKAQVTNLSLKPNATIILYAQWEAIQSNRVTGDFSPSYKSSVFYKNLQMVQNSEDKYERIAQVALSQTDYHESDSSRDFSGSSKGSNNYTEYGRWCGLSNGYGGWCSAFVSWTLYMADVPNASICTYGNYGQDNFGGKFTPCSSQVKASSFQKGDIIACTWSGNKTANHVEIVYNDPAKDGIVKTISGNSGDGRVVKRSYDLLTQKQCKIFGYIRL